MIKVIHLCKKASFSNRDRQKMYAVHSLLILCFLTTSSSSQGLFPEVDVSRLESTEPECDAALAALRQGLDTRQLWAHTSE